MTRISISSFIFLAMIGNLIVSGCISQPSTENLTAKIVSQTTFAVNSSQQFVNRQTVYEENLTMIQEKIPSEIFQILDPNSSIEIREYKKNQLFRGDPFIPVANASSRFNISDQKAIADGGEVYLHIDLQKTSPLNAIDSFTTKIDDKNEKSHYIDAWIGLNNIENVASLSNVTQIRVLHPGRNFG